MQKDLLLSVLFTASVFVLYEALRFRQIILPFSIAAILGSALAIFIAFRNNNSYNRWWEARTLWGNILNNSRIFARQIISNADYAANIGKASAEAVITYKKEMIYRQIAFAHALRLHLRKQHTFEEFEHLLTKAEFEKIILTQNLPNGILLTQGIRIKEGMRDEILGAFDNISLEPTLGGFNNFQGACERIKNTPLLCQYHFFTNLFLQVFMLILPFCLIGDFAKLQLTWLMIPVAVLISFVFGVMAKVGEVNEDPFENKITDVPLTALCNTIERDLKEMLYETVLPPTMEAEKGYLF
jgi:putative membrane protein